MIIKDLKELEVFLKLCRKQGVTEIKYGDCSVSFGEMTKKARKDSEEEDPEAIPAGFEALSPEQQMFFSVGGAPPP